MKRLVLLLLTCLPFTVLAQDEPLTLQNFSKGVKNISASFALNDQVNIVEIGISNDQFEVVAVDKQLKELWRTKLQGFALGAGKLKNKIVAVAATEASTFKGTGNTYKGFIIDPASGKVLTEKIIYTGDENYGQEYRLFFDRKDGAYFSLLVRQTAVERRMHIGLPGPLAVFTISKMSHQAQETRELVAISFDDNLEKITQVKPEVVEGTFADASFNPQGDLFVTWFTGPNTITTAQYPAGKAQPTDKISQDINTSKHLKTTEDGLTLLLCASKVDRNVVYYTFVHENDGGNPQLDIIKCNFAKGTKVAANDELTKDRLKSITKSFTVINKKLDDPDLGSNKNLKAKLIDETEGHLIVTLSGIFINRGAYSVGATENSYLFEVYDLNLQPQYTQVLPTSYTTANQALLPLGIYARGGKLYTISTHKTGMSSFAGVYGVMDIATGKWEKMEVLSKKKLDNGSCVLGDMVLWYNDAYIVPYVLARTFSVGKIDIDLQRNAR